MVNEVLEIINEYERWLQERLDKFGDENICNRLSETGGSNYDDFSIIYDTIIASVNYAEKYEEDGNIVLYNKTPIDGTFLNDITYKIVYDTKPKIDGSYISNSGNYNGNDDKMHDARFIFVERYLKYPQIGSSEFHQTVWHELQHAYVRYNVLKKIAEDEQLETNIKIDSRNKIYQNIQFDDKLHHNLKNIFYYTDTNEINSHLNEMIPYIKEHSEINFLNYKEYLVNIPGYFLLDLLKDMYKWLEIGVKNNTEFRNWFAKVISQKYNNLPKYQNKPIDTRKCIYMTLNRLSSAIVYSQNQFYKILFYTLKKLGRKQRYYEFHVRRQPRTLEQLDRDWEKMLKEFGVNLNI